MPLDRELSQRLEKRRDRTDADPVSPEPVVVDREYEAHIDQELKSKLRQQSELLSRTKTDESEVKRPQKAETHSARIDQELAKKLQKRQSELQELEATGTHAKAENLRGGASFEAHIDNELAAKLRKRLDVEARPLPEPVPRREAEGDLDDELAQKLRQRRQVVNSGDIFQKDPQIPCNEHGATVVQQSKNAEEPIATTMDGTLESKPKKRRFWWLFCCSLVVAAYGAYRSIPAE